MADTLLIHPDFASVQLQPAELPKARNQLHRDCYRLGEVYKKVLHLEAVVETDALYFMFSRHIDPDVSLIATTPQGYRDNGLLLLGYDDWKSSHPERVINPIDRRAFRDRVDDMRATLASKGYVVPQISLRATTNHQLDTYVIVPIRMRKKLEHLLDTMATL